jgi:hypothetical protein
MAIAGTGMPSAIRPKEVDVTVRGGPPADGRVRAAASPGDSARAGKAQVARDDQPRGCGAGPRHQQHKQRRRSRLWEPRPPQLPRPAPPRVAPEQQVAAASTGDSARMGEAQVAQEKASQPAAASLRDERADQETMRSTCTLEDITARQKDLRVIPQRRAAEEEK